MRSSKIAGLAVSLSLILCSHALAQTPSYTPFGQGCAGSAGVPLLAADAHSLPVLGGTFRAQLSNLPDGTAIGILGLSTSSFAGFAILPLDLGLIDMPGCTLFTDVRRMTVLTSIGGRATWDSILPSDPAFVGRSFFQQAFVLDATVQGLGAVMSNAGEGVIGVASTGAPNAEIAFPPANSLTDQGTILVRGSAFDPDGVAEVRVNGLLATTSDGYANWRVRVPLTPGDNSLTVYTRDTLGALDPQAAVARILSHSIYLDPKSIAIDLPRHRALVTDFASGAILAVDLTSGIATNFSSGRKGKGPGFERPYGIALDATRALVTDSMLGAITAVDLLSGDRKVISDGSTGRGPALLGSSPIAVHGRQALVASRKVFGIFISDAFLMAVDLETGDRRILSGDGVGRGPALRGIVKIVVDGNRALVLGHKSLLAVDLATGNRSVLSDENTGTGTPFSPSLSGLVLDGSRALVTDSGFGVILAIDLLTGNRSAIASIRFAGQGPDILSPAGLTLIGDRALVVESEGSLGLEGSRVVSVDLSSGERRVLSDDRLGAGPLVLAAQGIAVDSAHHRALAVQGSTASVLSVDFDSGDRRAVSGFTRGVGQPIGFPRGIALDGNRALVINGGQVLAIDLSTGDRSLLSDNGTGPGLGFGPLVGIALDTNRALVTSTGPNAVLAIDLATGERSIFSADGTGSGPSLGRVQGIAIDRARQRALIVDLETMAIIAINLTTGDRKILSGKSIGSGPGFVTPKSIAIDGTHAFVTDASFPGIFAIDLATGNRKVISSTDIGTGPEFSLSGPREIALHGGWALIGDPHSRSIMSVDVVTGERVILSK